MDSRTERVLSVVLTCCAVVFSALLIKREFWGAQSAAGAPGPPTLEKVSNWDELRANGIQLANPKADITVLELSDLECPACKSFHQRFKDVAGSVAGQIGLVFVHYPLSIHRFANAAARALECANEDGVAAQFIDVAYAKQDSFGLKTWGSYGLESGVRDSSRFTACVNASSPFSRIALGRKLGEAMEISGTPTVVVNGWKFSHAPTDQQLENVINAIKRGDRIPSPTKQ